MFTVLGSVQQQWWCAAPYRWVREKKYPKPVNWSLLRREGRGGLSSCVVWEGRPLLRYGSAGLQRKWSWAAGCGKWRRAMHFLLSRFWCSLFSHLRVSGGVSILLRATGCVRSLGLCETAGWLRPWGWRRLKLDRLSVSWSSKLHVTPEDGNKYEAWPVSEARRRHVVDT